MQTMSWIRWSPSFLLCGALLLPATVPGVSGAQALWAQEQDVGMMVAEGLSVRSGTARDLMVQMVMNTGDAGDEAREALVAIAGESESAVVVATAMGLLVRFANRSPGEVGAVTSILTRFVQDASYVKRAVTVDALENLPGAGRTAMVPILAGLAREGDDTPSTRLYLRGLWELGNDGLQAIQGMVNDGVLSGDSLKWARLYLREGA